MPTISTEELFKDEPQKRTISTEELLAQEEPTSSLPQGQPGQVDPTAYQYYKEMGHSDEDAKRLAVVVGESPENMAAYNKRMLTSFATPEIDTLLASGLKEVPFGARLGQLGTGLSSFARGQGWNPVPIETVKQSLSDFATQPNMTASEKLAGAIGSAAGSMAGFMPAAAASGGLSAILGAGKSLVNAISLLGGAGLHAAGRASAYKESIPEAIAQAEIGTLLSMGAGKLGAQLIPKQIPGAERIGSALGGATLGYLMPAETPEDKLINTLVSGGQMAAFPMKRNVLNPKQQIINIQNSIREGINKLKIHSPANLTSASKIKNYKEKIGSAIMEIFNNKDNLILSDENGNRVQGTPKDPFQVLEAISQLKKQKFEKMRELEEAATYQDMGAVDPVTGRLGKQTAFKIPVSDIMDVFNGMLSRKDVQIALKTDETMSNKILKLKSFLNRKKALSMEEVDALLKQANANFKDQTVPSGGKAAWGLMADAVRSTSERFLDSLETTAGKDWSKVRREYGALIELEKAMSKVARRYEGANPQRAGLVDTISTLSLAEIVKGVVSKSPSDILLGAGSKIAASLLKSNQDTGKVIDKMFRKIEHHTNLKTLNDVISAEAGRIARSERSGWPQETGGGRSAEAPFMEAPEMPLILQELNQKQGE
jgi:hypothetical protein